MEQFFGSFPMKYQKNHDLLGDFDWKAIQTADITEQVIKIGH